MMASSPSEDGASDLDGVDGIHFPNGWLSSHPPQRALRGGEISLESMAAFHICFRPKGMANVQ
jgi:hypothetical protein